VQKLVHGLSLHTICEEARCPNISECWGRGTATFQILGDTCTRACRYCYVHSGKPESPPDPLEPLRLAQAAAQMQLKHVVVTSVDRDDVPDRGAGHYAATIRALKAKLPGASVEVLTPDFLGVEEEALQTVLAARPEVFNHNIETVRRLHARMRGAKASYDGALWLLRRAKELADYPVLTKSGIIVGLGETNDEVVDTMRDLRRTASTSSRSASTSSRARSTRRSTAGCIPTSSAGSASRGGARLRLGLFRPASPLELPRRRAEARGRDRAAARSPTKTARARRTGPS
jgi:lipoic acid synthetase